MNLEFYISQLLYRHQCVIVPNFGAFITEKISAKIDEVSGEITPPSKSLVYNSLLQNTDGLLANHLVNVANVTFQQANQWIDEQVLIWKGELDNSKTLHLEKIGTFKTLSNGKLIFNPQGSANYLPASYGLTPLVAKRLANEKQLVQEKVISTKITKLDWWKYAAAALVGVSLIGTTFKYVSDNQTIEAKQLAMEKKVQDKVLEEIQQATFYLNAPSTTYKTSITTAFNSNKRYHIIAAAFKTRVKAEKFTNKLRNDGFVEACFTEKPVRHGRYYVLYQSFEKKDNAYEKLKRIREQNPQAWVYIRK